MNGDRKLFFGRKVNAVLNTWTGLQLLIRHNDSGSHFEQKVQWFYDVVAQLFHDNKDLLPHEVEEYLIDILDQEFDAVFEDGSTSEISKVLCNLYNLVICNKDGEVEELIKSLPKCSIEESKMEEHKVQDEPPELMESEELEGPDTEGTISIKQPDDEESWTLVQHKRR